MNINIQTIDRLAALLQTMEDMGATTTSRALMLLDVFKHGEKLTQQIHGGEHRLTALNEMAKCKTMVSRPANGKTRKAGSIWTIAPDAAKCLTELMGATEPEKRSPASVVANWLWVHRLTLHIMDASGWIARDENGKETIVCCVDSTAFNKMPFDIETNLEFALQVCAEAASVCGIHPPIIQ